MKEWMVQIGRFEISFAVTSLNRFSAAPFEGHLKRLVKIFGYLQNTTGRWKIIGILPEDIMEISGKGSNTADLLENYPGASEDIYEGIPDPRGRHPINTV